MRSQIGRLTQAKTFGALLCLALAPCYLLIIFDLAYSKTLAGVVLPLTGLATWCFFSGKQKFSELLSGAFAWSFCTLFIVCSAANLFVYGFKYAASWLISSAVFLTLTPFFSSLVSRSQNKI